MSTATRSTWRAGPGKNLCSLTLSALLGLSLLGCSDHRAAKSSATPGLDWQPCRLGLASSGTSEQGQCAELSVPARYQPGGTRGTSASPTPAADVDDKTTITLHIAKLPATGPKPLADPIYYLAGGPGHAANASFWGHAGAFRKLRKQRDVILVDQRGTGDQTALRCAFEHKPAPDLNPASQDTTTTATLLKTCVDTLKVDPRDYTSENSAHDIDRVRKALGVDQLNLYGVSYGTRLAQVYMRLYPERVRSAVLDGVLPLDISLGPQIARDAQRALDGTLDRCLNQPDCAKAFPQVREHLAQIVATLAKSGSQLQVFDPQTGLPKTTQLSPQRLTSFLRLLNYGTETSSLLPLIIEQAFQSGDNSHLATLALFVDGSLGETINGALNRSVLCAEDVAFWHAADFAASPALFHVLQSELRQELNQVCAVWPHAKLDPKVKQPLHSDIPTLLLSGALDPVTPPSNAAQLAATLPNSLHIIAPEQGHGVVQRGCIPRLFYQFVTDPKPKEIDASCAADLRAPPFFLNPSGPLP